MLEGKFAPLRLRVLVVDDELTHATAEGRAARLLVTDLEARNLEVIQAISATDGMAVVTSDAAIHAVLMDWSLDDDDAKTHEKARGLLSYIRSRNDRIPIFLMAERRDSSQLPVEVMQIVDEFIWTLEDTASFVSGRVEAAARRYVEAMLPPFAAALGRFARVHEYSWHTPGHTGGTAFLKSPVGRVFYDYFGENVLRSDLSISVGELGSLLDHTGPIGESREIRCARVRRAPHVLRHQRHVHVEPADLHGSGHARPDRAVRPQLPQVDRARADAHRRDPDLLRASAKPLGNHRPDPSRPVQEGVHRRGDRVESAAYTTASTARRCTASSRTRPTTGCATTPVAVEKLLDGTVDRVHWDEAWYGYARFNPIYRNRLRYARRSEGSHRADGVRDALHAQAACSAIAGFLSAHPRRARRDPAHALQRVVHDARVDVAAVYDHRVERHHVGDDGRSRRSDAHQRVH